MKKKTMKSKIIGCSCVKCINCCSNSCGWFGSIKEVEGASKIMKMPLIKFAKEYLIEEYLVGDKDISVIAPRKDFSRMEKHNFELDEKGRVEINKVINRIYTDEANKNGKGFVRASWGHNLITSVPCIFLDENDKCKIHDSKPQECRESFA
jgi:Fe-S-cluster containining protein